MRKELCGFTLCDIAEADDPLDVEDVNITAKDYTEVAIEDMKLFTNLRTLDASDNRFQLADMAHFPKLEELRLFCNGIKQVFPQNDIDATAFFPNLTFLDLSYNHLHHDGGVIASLAALPALTSLSLAHNQLTDDIFMFTMDVHFPMLTRLNLSGNDFNMGRFDGCWSFMSGLPQLRQVVLEGMSIDVIPLPPGRVDLFPNLRDIVLSDNKIGRVENVSVLGSLPEMRRVVLHRNPLSSPQALKAIKDGSPAPAIPRTVRNIAADIIVELEEPELVPATIAVPPRIAGLGAGATGRAKPTNSVPSGLSSSYVEPDESAIPKAIANLPPVLAEDMTFMTNPGYEDFATTNEQTADGEFIVERLDRRTVQAPPVPLRMGVRDIRVLYGQLRQVLENPTSYTWEKQLAAGRGAARLSKTQRGRQAAPVRARTPYLPPVSRHKTRSATPIIDADRMRHSLHSVAESNGSRVGSAVARVQRELDAVRTPSKTPTGMLGLL